MKYKLSILLAAMALAAGALAGGASATSGGVYVVTPHWWGWCPTSGVHAVYYWNQANGALGGDAGDDIVWVPVYLNQTNILTLAVECNAAWESSSTYTSIRPTRTGQAWYIGANGGTWHN